LIYYLDSSALVKRYIAELGSVEIARFFAGGEHLAVSWLALPETLAAMTRRAKGGGIGAEELQRIKTQLAEDWRSLLVLAVSGEPVAGVEALIARHALRGADSIHLASALWLQRSLQTPVTFVAADLELLAAARDERLSILNPADNG